VRIFSKTIITLSKAILALLFVFLSTDGIAQDNNVWVVDGTGIGFKLNFNIEPPLLTSLQDNAWQRSDGDQHKDRVVVCGQDGKLLYYTRNNFRTQWNSLEVFNANEELLFVNETEWDSILKYEASYIYLHNDTLTVVAEVLTGIGVPESLQLTKVLITDYEINNGYKKTKRWVVNFNEYQNGRLDLGRMAFATHENKLFAMYTHEDSVILAQIIEDKLVAYHWYKWPSLLYYQGSGQAQLPSQYFNSNFTKVNILFQDDEITDKNISFNRNYRTLDFDWEDGFSNMKSVYKNRDYSDQGSGPKANEGFSSVVSSPNGEYSYLLYNRFFNESHHLIKFKDGVEVERIRLPRWYYQMRLGPNGKIYVFPYLISKSEGEQGYVGVIENPDEDGPIKFTEPLEYALNSIVDKTEKNYIVYVLPNKDRPYKTVKFESDTLCSGVYAGFRNLTDSTHFERYRFYFGDGDSAEIDDDNNLLLAGRDNIANEDAWGVKHRYTKAGTYLVKLRAYNAAGGWVWYSHEVVVVEPSIPKFSVADTIGCEWIAYQIQDLSRVVNKGKDIMYHWTFGDGTDSTELNPRTNTRQYKTYSQSGDYKIQLTIDDGYCIDSFSLNNNVEILEAPRPGITAAPVEGCSPVRVEVNTTYSDVRDSVIYTWGDGEKSTSILGESSHTYLLAAGVSTSQYLTIYQSIHGPTGCVTTDSQTVIVHPGFLSADTPYLSLVTVNPDQQIEITWDSFPGATGYQLFRNGAWLADAATSNYTDASTKESLHEIATYTIYGTNVCEEKTLQSNIGQNIVLTGKGSEDNTISFLEWTPYQKWENGVVDYAIAVQNDDNSFTEIYRENANGTKKYTDETFLASALSGFATYKCYRIAAYELDYPQQISYSNVECVPFKPVIFIPTAFTPNGDNLNDVYRPVTFGIEFYEVKVYNRYGQLIADFDQNSKGWNAADAPTGAYMVTIRAKGTDNLWYNEKSTVTVVR
jgi:gliding motility-associated-like protein